MNISFKEKSIISVLIGLVTVFGYYFYVTLGIGISMPETIVLFVVATVALVFTQIVLHSFFAITSTKDANQPEDERDDLIDLKASRVSSHVLAGGALLSASLLFFGGNPLQMANAVLLSLVASEITHCALQLVYYRRGF